MTDIVDRLNGAAPSIPAMRDGAREIVRLRRTMLRAAEIIDTNLYHQREKVQDASAILRQALHND